MSEFDPNAFLIDLPRRQRVGDGQWKTVNLKYLQVRDRLVWLRHQSPDAQIETQIVQVDSIHCIVRASVSIPSGGSASGLGMSTPEKWADYVERAETKALGRALAALGFGTANCIDFDDAEGENLADSPVEPAARASSAPPAQPSKAAEPPASTDADARAEAAFWTEMKRMGLDELEVGRRLDDVPAKFRLAHKLTWGELISEVAKRANAATPAPIRQATPASNGPASDRLTEPQLKALHAIARSKSLGDDALRKWCRDKYVCEESDLTRRQASEFIDALKLATPG